MMALTPERDPGDRDQGDGEGFALVADQWHPSHIPAHMEPLPEPGSYALKNAAIDEARRLLARNRLAEDIEAVRAGFWFSTPAPARMVAMTAAKFPKERASEPLKNLNAFERGTAYLAVEKLIGDLETLLKCLQGGKIPQKGVH